MTTNPKDTIDTVRYPDAWCGHVLDRPEPDLEDVMKTQNLTTREKLLVTALRNAWSVLNAIRARDGTPYHHKDGMPYFDESYFDTLVDECDAAIEAVTGDMTKPWPFVWEMNATDSAAFVDALLNPPEPNEALRRAAEIYRIRSADQRGPTNG